MDFTDDDVASRGLSHLDYHSYNIKIGFLILCVLSVSKLVFFFLFLYA